jgi:hypothetical protein
VPDRHDDLAVGLRLGDDDREAKVALSSSPSHPPIGPAAETRRPFALSFRVFVTLGPIEATSLRLPRL